jgi:hypothetical protein
MNWRVAVLAGVLTLAGVGCGNDSGGGGGHPDAGPPQNKAWVRFGNLSPDAPALDICVRPSGSANFGSPVLAANGVPGGLSYPAMSKVVFIDPGTLDFRGVAAGGDCSTPVGGDLTAQVLDAHGTYTLTAVGQLAPGAEGPYRLQQYIDHQEAPASGKARFRFTNVIPNAPPIADGQTADGGTWVTQFTEAEMPFRFNASGVNILDGYQDIDPNPALPLTIRAVPPQQNPDLYTAPLNLRAGVITGVWAVGLLGGTGPQAVGYYVCDEIPAASGGQTNCNRQ